MAVDLRRFTPARVGLGRVVATADRLRFELDHARARDAVWAALDDFDGIRLETGAKDRATYLQRPDLGRRLASTSGLVKGEYDLSVVIADGLSALAVNRHAKPLLDELLPLLAGWRLAPTAIVRQGRVAVADEIGERLGAKFSLMLIGERPGLSSPDSLGAYLTYGPRIGRTDAERNCVSNIRAEGFAPHAAARWIFELLRMARAAQLTGVALKADPAMLLE